MNTVVETEELRNLTALLLFVYFMIGAAVGIIIGAGIAAASMN